MTDEKKAPKKPKKTPIRREGERYRLALTKADAKLSFSISPSEKGYTLRARSKSPEAGARIAAEHFDGSGAFADAKTRTDALVAQAKVKGWSEKAQHRSIEDLLA
jgi:hypothetical protein